MQVVVFGATGRTGSLVVVEALATGHTVTAVTSHPGAVEISHERLRVVPRDVLDASVVDGAVQGQEGGHRLDV